MDKAEAKEVVRAVVKRLDAQHCTRALRSGQSSGFHRGGAWISFGGGTGTEHQKCIVAAAFGLTPDPSDTSWWGAKANKNAFAAYEFLLRAAGGDAGTARFTEATLSLSDDDISNLLDEVLSSKRRSGGSKTGRK